MKWSLATGDLPIRASQTQQPSYQAYTEKYPGIQTFVENEQNATKARPVITTYNEISARRWARRSRPSCSARHSRSRRWTTLRRPGRHDPRQRSVILRAARLRARHRLAVRRSGRRPDRDLRLIPIGWSLLLSFQHNDLLSPPTWVGLDNYRALDDDPVFTRLGPADARLHAAVRAAVGRRSAGCRARCSNAPLRLRHALPDGGLHPRRDLDRRHRHHLQLAARADLRRRQLPAEQGRHRPRGVLPGSRPGAVLRSSR